MGLSRVLSILLLENLKIKCVITKQPIHVQSFNYTKMETKPREAKLALFILDVHSFINRSPMKTTT